MKKNLGRLFLLLLLPLLAFAQSELATHTLSVSKQSPYVKEAVEITFTAVQKDHEYVMFFFLESHQSDNYEITLLNKATKKIGYHNYMTTFTYLLFPLKPGKINVDFEYTIKTASDKAVAQVYIGSRDNVKWIDTDDTVMPKQSVRLDIKALPKGIELVGDFKIKSVLKSSTIDQFSTAQVVYTLNGVGYVNKGLSPLHKVDNVTIFEDTHDEAFKITKNGQVLEREYLYALSADDDFVIPAVKIKAYSPRTQKFYTLSADAYPIRVKKLDPSTLLDDKESPTSDTVDFTWLVNIIIGIIIFISGFITAKLSENISFGWLQREKKFQDIKTAVDAKSLLFIMIRNYKSSMMQPYIDRLEAIAYTKENKRSFKQIKKEILKHL